MLVISHLGLISPHPSINDSLIGPWLVVATHLLIREEIGVEWGLISTKWGITNRSL